MDPITLDLDQDACCPEYADLSRRSVLRGALALGGATFMVGGATVSASAAAAKPASAVLVVLSLRGGADGMSLVVPHGDDGYYKARPTISIPADKLLVPDSMFGLHPNFGPLTDLWNAGQVAAVHATGLTTANRSHFSAMEEVEEAHPGSSKRIGWLNRLVGASTSHHNPLQGVGLGGGTPPTELSGPIPLMTVDSLSNAAISGDDTGDTNPAHKRIRSLQTLWGHDHSPMGVAVRSTMKATKNLGPAKSAADNQASYPNADVGHALAQAAQIIRGNIGVEVITVDQGAWDMHVNLGDLNGGEMVGNAANLAAAMAAFLADLGDQADKVTLVTISEFGRRTQENGDRGLDHGWGNVMFVAGQHVKGGYYCKEWKSLSDHLEDDLSVTTDYRNVLREVVASRFPAAKTSKVFPGLKSHTLGFMKTV
jgi:uncharacterized protein (DUF1501 family)